MKARRSSAEVWCRPAPIPLPVILDIRLEVGVERALIDSEKACARSARRIPRIRTAPGRARSRLALAPRGQRQPVTEINQDIDRHGVVRDLPQPRGVGTGIECRVEAITQAF